jgi:hypothetical protein
MSDDGSQFTSQSSVVVESSGSDWLVKVIENGIEQVAVYPRESYAQSFAAGQRTRLRLSPDKDVGSGTVDERFRQVVAIMLNGEWIGVQSGREALFLLLGAWPEKHGASYERALAASRAWVEGRGTEALSRSTLCVAAMEAGLGFELYDDYMNFLEAEIALVTKIAVRDEGRRHAASGGKGYEENI